MILNSRLDRVAVTGVGVVTPFGRGADTLWQAALAGDCMIQPTARFAAPPGISPLAAALPESIVAEVKRDFTGRFCAWALVETLAEMRKSGQLGRSPGRPAGRGAVFFANHFNADAQLDLRDTDHVLTAGLLEEWALDRWPAWLQKQVGSEIGVGIITACSASNLAIGLGYDWIIHGWGDWAVVGGMDMLHVELMLEFESLRILSHTGCRPFSSDHDGTVLGDGAALLLLERLDTALKRGATIYAEVVGYGQALDMTGPARLDPDGKAVCEAMAAALRQGEIQPADVGYINAGATGSPVVDDSEVHALLTLFENVPPPVSSLKSQIGHSIGGAGAIEAIMTVLALQHQKLPPTLGITTPTSHMLDIVPRARAHHFEYALNNAIAMNGHICSTLFRRGDA